MTKKKKQPDALKKNSDTTEQTRITEYTNGRGWRRS